MPSLQPKIGNRNFLTKDLKESDIGKKMYEKSEYICYSNGVFLPEESKLLEKIKKSTYRLNKGCVSLKVKKIQLEV